MHDMDRGETDFLHSVDQRPDPRVMTKGQAQGPGLGLA